MLARERRMCGGYLRASQAPGIPIVSPSELLARIRVLPLLTERVYRSREDSTEVRFRAAEMLGGLHLPLLG